MTPSRTLLIALALSSIALPAAAQQAPRPSFEPVTVPQQQQPQQPQATQPANSGQQAAPDSGGGPRVGGPYTGQYPRRNGPGGQQNVDQATLDRAERQNQGNMTPIDRGTVAGPGVPLGTTQDAWANPRGAMSDGQVAPGVIRFRWRPELVMPMRIREYMITTITLPEWEKAEDVLIGESLYFKARIVRDNTVAVKASASGIDTSVNVIGESGNNYTFYLRAEPYNTNQLTDLSVFVDAAPASQSDDWFRDQGGLSGAWPRTDVPKTPGAGPDQPVIDMDEYGQTRSDSGSTSANTRASVSGDRASGRAVAGAQWYVPKDDMMFAHRMFEVNDGDRVIAPNTVYTNGTWTFFHYGKRAGTVDRPVVYRVVDGVETLVNSRWIGRNNEVLVAEAVGNFVLRNGQRTVCVNRKEQRTPTAGDGHDIAMEANQATDPDAAPDAAPDTQPTQPGNDR